MNQNSALNSALKSALQTQGQEVSSELPKSLAQAQPSQKEMLQHGGMSPDELILPRLSLLKNDKDGVKAGTLVNNITGEPVDGLFTPLFSYNTYMKINGVDIEWISLDRTDPRVIKGLEWKNLPDGKKIKPEVTHIINFVGYVGENYSVPVVAAFKRTSLRAGRRFHTACFSQCRGTTLIEGTFFKQFNYKRKYELIVKTVLDRVYGQYFTLEFSLPKNQADALIPDNIQKQLWEKAKEAAILVEALSTSSKFELGNDGDVEL